MPIIKCDYCGKEVFKRTCDMKFKNHFCNRKCHDLFLNTNKFIVEKDYAKMILQSKTYGIKEVFIDIEDINKIKKYCWGIHYFKESKCFYITTTIEKPKKHSVLLHRYIMDCPLDMLIDHQDHNTLNNQKNNLRICTDKQNNENILEAKSNNKYSKIRGVHYLKDSNKYKAQIVHHGKHICAGYFSDIKQAEIAVIELRKKYFTHSPECNGVICQK